MFYIVYKFWIVFIKNRILSCIYYFIWCFGKTIILHFSRKTNKNTNIKMAENAINHKIVWTVYDNIVGNNIEINAAKYDMVALVLNYNIYKNWFKTICLWICCHIWICSGLIFLKLLYNCISNTKNIVLLV